MLLPLSTFGLFLGGLFLFLMIPAGLLSAVSRRTRAVITPRVLLTLFLLGVVLTTAGIIGISLSRDQGPNTISAGTILFFVGIPVTALGLWFAFWAPISQRNAKNGLLYIGIGVALMVLGVLIMPFTGFQIGSSNGGPRYRHGEGLTEIMSRRTGPLPFGGFAVGMLLFANGLGIRNHLSTRRLLAGNLVVLALLVVLYFLGPSIFRGWY